MPLDRHLYSHAHVVGRVSVSNLRAYHRRPGLRETRYGVRSEISRVQVNVLSAGYEEARDLQDCSGPCWTRVDTDPEVSLR